MQEDEKITKYSDRISLIVNKIKLLSEEFSDRRIVEKFLLTLPERFESKISSLEESKDLSQVTLAELMNALRAQKQRRVLRQDKVTKDAFHAQNLQGDKGKKHFNKKTKDKSEGSGGQEGTSKKNILSLQVLQEEYTSGEILLVEIRCYMWKLQAIRPCCKGVQIQEQKSTDSTSTSS
ncbi:hypothetical protein ACH5RR_015949 [Cinchona calisaya]|uniref:Uncharacterized protein n=1 Tax=Cinchona calisaya TaxID=153742 RepID=A0ABD2ZUI5_9GENT